MGSFTRTFKRRHQDHKAPSRIPIEGSGITFLFKSRMGTRALEPMAAAMAGAVDQLFPAMAELIVGAVIDEPALVDGVVVDDEGVVTDPASGEVIEPGTELDAAAAYRALMALDLDLEEELGPLLDIVAEGAGMTAGEPSASPSPSDDVEASSSTTSDGSSASTSTPSAADPTETPSFS